MDRWFAEAVTVLLAIFRSTAREDETQRSVATISRRSPRRTTYSGSRASVLTDTSTRRLNNFENFPRGETARGFPEARHSTFLRTIRAERSRSGIGEGQGDVPRARRKVCQKSRAVRSREVCCLSFSLSLSLSLSVRLLAGNRLLVAGAASRGSGTSSSVGQRLATSFLGIVVNVVAE